MAESVFEMRGDPRLLVDLQQVNAIAQSFSGCLEPAEIARQVTDGLVEKFGCVFARIWLMEPERTMLKLVASAGLYQRTDGFFAKVPVGAFKVGKIAQNQIPFLSNQLAAETWVLDRDWAISNGIKGFAGYPLIANGDSIGVLAVFSQTEMLPEFLEILQSLCTATTIRLAAALRYQQQRQAWQSQVASSADRIQLSEQLAKILSQTQLMSIGTERALSTPIHNLLLRTAEILSQFPCLHSRLNYLDRERLSLEVVIAGDLNDAILCNAFSAVRLEAMCLGGTLEIQPQAERRMLRASLMVTSMPNGGGRVNLRCRDSVLQMAFAHLIELAGLAVAPIVDPDLPLLTDDRALVTSNSNLLWIELHGTVPAQARGKIDLSIDPSKLRSAVEAVMRGEEWEIDRTEESSPLSDREREIMQLLAKGLRDRDIASRLIVSESTVKFHINNILAKVKAKTRFQALYLVMMKGSI